MQWAIRSDFLHSCCEGVGLGEHDIGLDGRALGFYSNEKANMRELLRVLGCAVLLLAGSVANAENFRLRLVGLDGVEQLVTADAWAALPRAHVETIDHEGKPVTFDGVRANELLNLVKAPLGRDLRGKNLSLYVVATAADGYSVVYALTELDPEFTDRTILIADRRDGQASPEQDGPLRVVVPGEKRQARWLRQLVQLKLLRAP